VECKISVAKVQLKIKKDIFNLIKTLKMLHKYIMTITTVFFNRSRFTYRSMPLRIFIKTLNIKFKTRSALNRHYT